MSEPVAPPTITITISSIEVVYVFFSELGNGTYGKVYKYQKKDKQSPSICDGGTEIPEFIAVKI